MWRCLVMGVSRVFVLAQGCEVGDHGAVLGEVCRVGCVGFLYGGGELFQGAGEAAAEYEVCGDAVGGEGLPRACGPGCYVVCGVVYFHGLSQDGFPADVGIPADFGIAVDAGIV